MLKEIQIPILHSAPHKLLFPIRIYITQKNAAHLFYDMIVFHRGVQTDYPARTSYKK